PEVPEANRIEDPEVPEANGKEDQTPTNLPDRQARCRAQASLQKYLKPIE
ncbi:hypothetical protein BOX15_Mlig003368g1, partial [Macrostomum lignano]